MEDLTLDINSLATKTRLSDGVDRRDFIKAALGSGFAAAVMPVAAQSVVKTDTQGLLAGEVSIMVDGTAVPVYRAQPEGKTNLPVILVVSEIFGVHEHIADVARRFAKLGYLALAPELFVRAGDPGSLGTIAEILSEIIAKTPDAQIMRDLDACLAWAGKNGGDTARAGITGFCWGGRVTWMYAAHNPAVRAGVAWYGKLVGGYQKDGGTRNPIDIAATLTTPVLGLYAGKDEGIPLASVEQMKAALAKGKSQSAFVTYPDAVHAFHADYRPSYNAAAAKDGWQRCVAWFKAHGVA